MAVLYVLEGGGGGGGACCWHGTVQGTKPTVSKENVGIVPPSSRMKFSLGIRAHILSLKRTRAHKEITDRLSSQPLWP